MVAFAERVEQNSSHNSGWWLPTLETDFSSDPEGAGPDEKPNSCI
jgi:hypothetical protein